MADYIPHWYVLCWEAEVSGYPKTHPPQVGLAGLDTQWNLRSGKGQAKVSQQRKCLWSHSMLNLHPRVPGDLDGVALGGVEGRP